jgi:hypothetical protein
MSIEAMKQALEIIKNMRSNYGDDYHTGKERTAMDALRQAIEQAEKQEPKAWIYEGNLHIFDPTDWAIEPESVQPLYAAPPKREQEPFAPDWVNYRQGVIDGAAQREWVGLTEYEVHKIIDDCTPDEAEIEELIDFSIAILAVEAKLKERNT